MGIRGAAVSELIFEDCRLPKEQVLGKVGKGMHVAFSGLDSGRVGIAAQSIGYGQAALDAAIEYSKQRVQFKKPISANQGLQWYLAEMATRLEAANIAHVVYDHRRLCVSRRSFPSGYFVYLYQ